MKALLLRFDAPLISFGAPMVDQNGVVQAFPALSMLTGLLANALGWDHRDAGKLSLLQDRIRYAARIDRRGEALVDYQTVDLGKEWMIPETAGWTTRGKIASRGGASGEMTHQRYRHYRADSVHTVAISVNTEQAPTLDDLQAALREPARPLFIGRKCCLPASPVLLGMIDAPSLLAALATVPRSYRADDGPLRATWWDGDDASEADGTSHVVPVTDERDWRNQIHTGRRLMAEGRVNPRGAGDV
ncbi:MAG: type I-E CRISPR-associated protein Cas5/CasD [Gemmatimonadaceae bacterium]